MISVLNFSITASIHPARRTESLYLEPTVSTGTKYSPRKDNCTTVSSVLSLELKQEPYFDSAKGTAPLNLKPAVLTGKVYSPSKDKCFIVSSV